jgi:hypothetical protein
MFAEFIEPRKRLGYSVAAVDRADYTDIGRMYCLSMALKFIVTGKCQVAIYVTTYKALLTTVLSVSH